MTQHISATAAATRESSRQHDGKFGTQARSEADLELTEPAPVTVETIGAIAALSSAPGFTQAGLQADGSVRAQTVHGYDVTVTEGDGGWWAAADGVPGKIHDINAVAAAQLAALEQHRRTEVGSRLARELLFHGTAANRSPQVHSVSTLETEQDGARTTVAVIDDPVNPGTTCQVTAMQQRTATGEHQRGLAKDEIMLDEENCQQLLGARYGQVYDALHGGGLYADASVYSDGTSVAARYNASVEALREAADDAGVSVSIVHVFDPQADGVLEQTPAVRFTANTHGYTATVRVIAEEEPDLLLDGRPVASFPDSARKARTAHSFALERLAQLKELNRLRATGLAQ